MRTNDKIRIAVLVALSSGRAVAGDVVFDGTTGAAGDAQFNSLTNTFSIRQQDGTLAGSNLFHSFSTFNIDVAETAEFTATATVNNVISRVTSLQPTTINGTVRSLIPNANFWFINPAGITVGATGVIDVQGAIAFGSADFVEFQNGQQWHALTTTGGAAAGGLIVNPTDFGFLPGSTAGTLSVSNQNFSATAAGEPQIGGRSWLLTGGAGVDVTSSGSLFLEDGKIETNRGGNVLVAGAGVEFRNTQIYAPRARVGIASVADPSTLVLDDNASFVFGDVPRESLRPIRFNDYEPGQVIHPFTGNIINTSSDSFVGGGVYLLGGEITLRSTLINSDSLQGSPADQAAKGIHMVGESLDINRNTSLTSVVRGAEPFFTADDDGIANENPAEGDGGSITIDLYGDLTVSGTEDQSFADGNNFHTQISSRTFSSGDGGDITINAANVTLDGPQSLAGPAPTAAELDLGGPAAGFIASSNDAVDRDDFASRSAATGNAGDINITLSGTLRLRGLRWSEGVDPTDPNRATVIGIGGASIGSDTQHVGFLDDGLGNPLGTAGDITIAAASLEIEGAGQITSVTSGPARGGNIDVTLTGGHLSISTDPSATFTSGIFTRATSAVDNPQFGNAGNITIDVSATDPAEGHVSLSGIGQNGLGSRLFSDAIFSQGDAGSINVDASGPISLTGASVRTDVANDQEAFAGDITLRSDSLVTIDSSLVSSQSTSANAAGNITVEGSGVLIHNGSRVLADYDNAGSNPGEPGSINITATGTSTETNPEDIRDEATTGVVRIVDSGVNANNNGGGDDADRGDITILADDIVVAGSVVATDVVAGGVGDNIVIRGDRSVSLLRSDGAGFELLGTVIPPIDPRGDIQRSLISARTQSSAAAGGLIRVEVGSGGTLTVEDSNIDTSTSIDGSNVSPDRVRSNIALVATGGSIETSGAVLTTETTGLDPAGNIQVTGDRIELRNTMLQASTSGSGDAGSISVTSSPSGSIFIGDVSSLLSDASEGIERFDFDTGLILEQLPNAGTVEINGGTGGVEIHDTSMASSAGPRAGQAGTVSITSAGTLTMTGNDVNTSVETDRTLGAGDPQPPLNPAQIALNAAGAVSLTNTTLGSETFGAIDAGNISLTGSEVTVSGGEITAATLVNPDPAIDIINTGNAGTVTLTANTGATRVIGGARVSTSSEGLQGGQAGIITITGNGVELQGAIVTTAVASAAGGLTPARIDLDATTGDLSLTGSTLSAATSGTASAGNITLEGASIAVSGGSITAATTSTGDAGLVRIVAADGDVELTDGANVETSARDEVTSSTDLGEAGTITVTGSNVTLAGASLSTSTDSDVSSLTPAEIILDAGGTLSLTDTSLSAATTGAASAGDVSLTGASISMSGGSITASTTSTGDAGIVTIIADTGGDVELTDGASVETSALDAVTLSTNLGQAGTITVTGANLTLADASLSTSTDSNDTTDTPAGIIVDAVGALSLTNTSVSAETSGAASAGNISLNGASIAMTGGSASSSAVGNDSSETNLGAAGRIVLDASSITLADARLTTTTDSDIATLTAAEIALSATGVLSLTNTDLSAATTGAASAGNITLSGSSVAMSGGSVTASTTSTGNAGQLAITAAAGGDVDITNGTDIITSSSGATSGAAGTIRVVGADVTFAGATLSTSTGSDIVTLAPAAIVLDAEGALSLTNTNVSASTSGAASAGNITLDGASIAMGGGSISASTTDAGNAGEVRLTAPNAVAVTNGASIETSSEGPNSGKAGTIAISGSSITLAGADVTTSTESNIATQAPARIDLTTPGALSLTNTNLSASTSGAAFAGNITLAGASIAMSGGSITASTIAAGNAGQVSLTAAEGGDVDLTAGAEIATSSSGAASGAAGRITVTGADLTLANASLSTSTGSDITTLAPAEIALTAGGALALTNTTLSAATSGGASAGSIALTGASIAMSGGTVTATTSGAGDAGRVTLAATNGAVQISNNAEIETSSTAAGAGAAGTIDIDGSSISLANARVATSVASTRGGLTAAQITLDTPGAISLTNTTLNAETSGAAAAGNILLTGSSITMSDGEITARTTGGGNAGRVALAVPGNVTISNGAVIETSSVGASAGAAGTIDIHGSQVSLANTRVATSIESNVPGLAPAAITLAANGSMSLTDGTAVDATTRGAAPGGSIVITGGAILVDESSVSSQTAGAGDAGSVCLAAGSTACAPQSTGRAQILAADVPAAGGITLSGSNLSTSTTSSGSAGNVDVHATGTLLLLNSTLQSSSSASSNAGNGGSINLSSGLSNELLIEDSMVQTNAEAAEGGDITLDGGGSPINLKNSVLFASAGANGNGGDVTVSNIGTTLIEHSLILAQAERGNGGSILLTLQDGATFLQDSQSQINADSQQGINGEVSINRPNTDLNSSIAPQEVDVSKPAELGTDVCAPATPGARSTFVREGRGGVAESPDSYMTTMPATGTAPERTSASGKSEPVAKTAARSSDAQSTQKVTRGCF